jgi:hypothetical protein
MCSSGGSDYAAGSPALRATLIDPLIEVASYQPLIGTVVERSRTGNGGVEFDASPPILISTSTPPRNPDEGRDSSYTFLPSNIEAENRTMRPNRSKQPTVTNR